MPFAWKTASKDRVKFDPRSRIRNRKFSNRSPRVRARLRGLLHGPFAGGVRGDAAEVHPAGAVLDEHQDVQPFQQHGVDVQEVDCEDSGGLGAQELPPGRARAARRRADARSSQDLIDGGRRDRDAELGQLAVDPAVAPQRIFFCQANDKAGDAADCWRAAGLAPPARVVLSRSQPAVPGQQRRWRHRKDPGPALAGYQPRQRGEPHSVGGLVPYPPGVPAQHRVLVPEHQQFSLHGQVPAEHQDGEGGYKTDYQADDLERHSASQPPPPPGHKRLRRSATQSSI